MKEWYWRVVAAVAVVVAAAYVFGVCRPLSPAPVEAVAGNMIALAPSDQNSYALYIIDTSKKVLLVYNSRGRGTLGDFGLIYGRSIEADAVLAQRGEITFNRNGYTAAKIMRELKRLPPP